MKRIKLFEQFIIERNSTSLPDFDMPALYEMPKGLSQNSVYIIRLTLLCENMIYALVDYKQLENIYKALNLNLIATKIDWYNWAIAYPKPKVYVPPGGDNSDPLYPNKVLMRKDWNIEVVAEEKGGNFPYYVYFGGSDSTGGLRKKLDDASKRCKVCGEDPGKLDVRPGITCSMGTEDFVIFDPEMRLDLTNILFPSEDGSDPLDGEERSGYYVRFDNLGGFLASWHGGYGEFDSRYINSDSVVVDNNVILDLLPYKDILYRVKKDLEKRDNANEFIHGIFTYLIDSEVPTPLIQDVNSILNREDYTPQNIKYYKVETHNYQKRQLSGFSDPVVKYSPTPDFKSARFFLALPGDKKIVDAVLKKMPKDYKEIYSGLDSMPTSDFEKLKSKMKSDYSSWESQKLIDKVLKHSIYVTQPSSATQDELALHDEGLPTKASFSEDTHCSFSYGIYDEITLEEIESMSPIELYLNVYFVNPSFK